jgi:hypothetical protein
MAKKFDIAIDGYARRIPSRTVHIESNKKKRYKVIEAGTRLEEGSPTFKSISSKVRRLKCNLD